MQFNSQSLIQSLQADTRAIILQVNQWQNLPEATLLAAPGEGRWSAAQVIEHLNVYARHYIPAIEQQLRDHRTQPSVSFRTGWLGGYFTKLMAPGADGKIVNKMSAPKNARPSAELDVQQVFSECLDYQQRLLLVLEQARNANLSELRVPTSLSRLIALKLGDTFRFFIAHQQRHMVQIRNLL